MPSSIRVVDGLAGVSAPAEHVAIGFTGWRCQASPATQDGSPTSRRRSFYLFLMPDAFPSMPLTDAQAAVKAGEAVLAHNRRCPSAYTKKSVCRTLAVRGLRDRDYRQVYKERTVASVADAWSEQRLTRA